MLRPHLQHGLKLALLAALLHTPAQAEDKTLTPEQALAQAGSFTLDDNASFYNFKRDGSFSSTPNGISGRTLTGHWTSDGPGHYRVVALLGWINGLSQNNQYKAIDFTIYPGRLVSTQAGERQFPSPPHNRFEAYYIINSLQDAPPP